MNMGYSTSFKGKLHFNRPLHHKEWLELTELASYNQEVYEKYAIDGNTIPGSYLQWEPDQDGLYYGWNGAEKFYEYVEWLRWVIESYMKPHGLVLNGQMSYQGEEDDDKGEIIVMDNLVSVKEFSEVVLLIKFPTSEHREAFKKWFIQDGAQRFIDTQHTASEENKYLHQVIFNESENIISAEQQTL